MADSTASTKAANAAISQRRRKAQTMAMRPTMIGRTGAPPTCEPTSAIEVSVPVRWWARVSLTLSSVLSSPSPLAGKHYVHDEQGEEDRGRCQQQEAGQQREEEDEGGMAGVEPGGETVGRATRAGVEDRNGMAVAGPLAPGRRLCS